MNVDFWINQLTEYITKDGRIKLTVEDCQDILELLKELKRSKVRELEYIANIKQVENCVKYMKSCK